jgi:hypothetical protein
MQQQDTNTRYLVETAWLQEHLGDPDLRILDCTVYLPNYFDESAEKKVEIVPGLQDYTRSHIPGSVYVDLVGELTDKGNKKFMFPMPSADQFASVMSRLGVGEGTFKLLSIRFFDARAASDPSQSSAEACLHFDVGTTVVVHRGCRAKSFVFEDQRTPTSLWQSARGRELAATIELFALTFPKCDVERTVELTELGKVWLVACEDHDFTLFASECGLPASLVARAAALFIDLLSFYLNRSRVRTTRGWLRDAVWLEILGHNEWRADRNEIGWAELELGIAKRGNRDGSLNPLPLSATDAVLAPQGLNALEVVIDVSKMLRNRAIESQIGTLLTAAGLPSGLPPQAIDDRLLESTRKRLYRNRSYLSDVLGVCQEG